MNVIQQRQEKTASNIANSNTVGYKFQEILQITANERAIINFSGGGNKDQLQEIGRLNLSNEIDSIYRGMNQGNLKDTGRTLDYALEGAGFFTVRLNDGTLAFTRNGNFKKNSENYLMSIDENPVIGLDEDGNTMEIMVIDDNINMELMIVDFDSYENLQYIGDNLFINDQYNVIEGDIKQGSLEMSNVNIGDEMVKMIEILREFQSNQRVMHSIDETLAKAVNEIGKL